MPQNDRVSLPWSAKWLIIKASLLTGGFGIGGAFFGPGADVPFIIAIWATLVVSLAGEADVTMTKETAAGIATSVITGVALAFAGVKAGATVFAYTGIGTVPAIVANAGLNAVVTFIFGKAVAAAFRTQDSFDSAETFAKNIMTIILSSLGLPVSEI